MARTNGRSHRCSNLLLPQLGRLASPPLVVAVIAVASTIFSSTVRAQTFVEVTAAAGINHVQADPTVLATLPGPAFMTGGVAAGDFDGDGLVDLVFSRLGDTDLFYRNQGDGTFESRTSTAGFSTATLTNGVVSGDIDNDGDLDLYMTSTNDTRNYLYLNDGTGFFTDAGSSNPATLDNGVNRFGQGASFGDYDNDGYLDLITGAWGSPVADSQSRLFRNLGSTNPGQFEDVTVTAGIDTYRKATAYRFSPRMIDLDRDGHLDLAIASDFVTSQIFWSNGDGTFTDGTLAAGVGTDENGMGSTFADYDGDGDLDWFITNITEHPNHPGGGGSNNRLYRNDGNRQFTDVTTEAGVRDSRWSWGTSFFDYDNDGDQDLIATNGWNGAGWADDQTYLWRNDNGVYTDVSTELGITDTLQGRGLAHLDYDNDGDIDLVVVNHNAAPVLYRNDGPGGDNNNGGAPANDYLRLEFIGTQSNRDGIGAFVTVTPDINSPEESMVWEVDGGSSFLSQNERTAHFGLGANVDSVDLVKIEWPSGLVQLAFDLPSNQTIAAIEVDQAAQADFNGDNQVDATDYALWRDTMGDTLQAGGNMAADGNGDDIVDWQDYLLWHTQFGRSVPGGTLTAPIPEPGTRWLLGLALVGVTLLARSTHARQSQPSS